MKREEGEEAVAAVSFSSWSDLYCAFLRYDSDVAIEDISVKISASPGGIIDK